ncbi:coiled-coil domain-containing protein 39 isoform X1 [Electrophorus electricus]|uniref:coiled-coil domain-containing protein 39 isoform X1 n=1 Tax=Electrophorus electricus TaxID=8005 RepID=UPI0015CFD91B|nr:coiled-coil domain-containing protein 39 isoform X1 [Electrophorus electricus]
MANAVLNEVGWDDGFAIPVANAENKAVEDEIKRKQKEKSEVENKLSNCKDRINAMTEHLKNVRQELGHTQALCRAREKENESEVHFKALAERETGRLRQEIAQLENELGSLREKKNSQENNIFKANQKLEELKSQLNWDQQTLDAWLEESARRDEDTMAIAKYAQQDEGRIRELTLSIEKLTLEANQKRKALDSELTETITAQISLDKIAETFRQAHAERQELLRQWESTIEQMRRRDQEMQQGTMLLAEANQAIRQRQALVQEKQSFLSSEVQNNRDCERKISATERQAAQLRQQYQEQENDRARLRDELETLKGTVDRTATEVEAMRSHAANLKKELNNKTTKLQDAQQHNTTLGEKLQAVTEAALSVEERAVQMEQLLRDQEHTIKEIETQLQRQREVLFRKSQELQALRANEKSAVAELSGSQTILSNLESRLSKLDQNALKQQEIIHNQDFQIQVLERKMARLCGELGTEEKETLEKRTAELMKALEEKRKTAATLTIQLKRVQDDIRCVRKEMEKTRAEKRNLTTRIEELHLFNDTSDKELKKLCLKKQDRMVEDNLLKLETKRLSELLSGRADGVLSLERRRLQLQTAMRERQEEIRLHTEMLAKQLRTTDQERQMLSAEVHERLSKIDKMKKRYEILTVAMAAPEGEEEKSQAYYVIKAAQEKEELQREGDNLDAKIRKMEKEIKALENTLHVVNDHNTTYRKSFSKVTESCPEYQEKLRLQEQKRAAEEKYKFKRRQIRELQEDIEGMDSSLNNLLKEEAAQSEKTNDVQARILALSKDLTSQQDKLDRVAKQCKRLTKEIRSAKKTREETFEEQDIELRGLKDCNKTISKMLLEVMEQQPDLQATLQMYFIQPPEFKDKLSAQFCVSQIRVLSWQQPQEFDSAVVRCEGSGAGLGTVGLLPSLVQSLPPLLSHPQHQQQWQEQSAQESIDCSFSSTHHKYLSYGICLFNTEGQVLQLNQMTDCCHFYILHF